MRFFAETSVLINNGYVSENVKLSSYIILTKVFPTYNTKKEQHCSMLVLFARLEADEIMRNISFFIVCKWIYQLCNNYDTVSIHLSHSFLIKICLENVAMHGTAMTTLTRWYRFITAENAVGLTLISECYHLSDHEDLIRVWERRDIYLYLGEGWWKRIFQ